MGGNFKIKKQAPMDDRSTVAKKIDLQNPNLFDGFTYNGMIVSVVDDTINNGLYRLEDKSTLTWKKVGGDVDLTNYYTKSETYNKVETVSLVNTKQDNLVSGTNIKTINGQSVLGSGNIVISGGGAVDSVAGKTGVVTLAKSDVGLGNVDNTSDLNKPISTATQNALNNKVDKVAGKQLSTEDYTTAEKNKLSNLSDYIKPASEPISYIDGLQTSLDSKINSYNISNIEYNTGIKRNNKDAFCNNPHI